MVWMPINLNGLIGPGIKLVGPLINSLKSRLRSKLFMKLVGETPLLVVLVYAKCEPEIEDNSSTLRSGLPRLNNRQPFWEALIFQ